VVEGLSIKSKIARNEISGLLQSAGRQIAFSLHELIAPAEAALSWPTGTAEMPV
jgi:hypothetical protein